MVLKLLQIHKLLCNTDPWVVIVKQPMSFEITKHLKTKLFLLKLLIYVALYSLLLLLDLLLKLLFQSAFLLLQPNDFFFDDLSCLYKELLL